MTAFQIGHAGVSEIRERLIRAWSDARTPCAPCARTAQTTSSHSVEVRLFPFHPVYAAGFAMPLLSSVIFLPSLFTKK